MTRPELFNLKDDPGETDNLVEENQKVAGELHGRLQAWCDGIHAPVPTESNPDYDPSTARSGGKRRR